MGSTKLFLSKVCNINSALTTKAGYGTSEGSLISYIIIYSNPAALSVCLILSKFKHILGVGIFFSLVYKAKMFVASYKNTYFYIIEIVNLVDEVYSKGIKTEAVNRNEQ